MTREKMGLTLEDLKILSTLNQAQPRFHASAARLAGLSRARLARLLERINEQIGEGLDWRVDGRFRLPPEVRRLVSQYDAFADALELAGQAPRISAGTTATFLLIEVIHEVGRDLPRLGLVRSRDIWRALESDEIDIAIVHGRSVDFKAGTERQELRSGFLAVSLVDWNAVVIRRDNSRSGDWQSQAHAYWEPGSAGDYLNRVTGHLKSGEAIKSLPIPCQSYLHAIELVRRGLISQAVIPDIYFPVPATDLIAELPPTRYRDHLVAIFRADEELRWGWLFSRAAWERVAARARQASLDSFIP